MRRNNQKRLLHNGIEKEGEEEREKEKGREGESYKEGVPVDHAVKDMDGIVVTARRKERICSMEGHLTHSKLVIPVVTHVCRHEHDHVDENEDGSMTYLGIQAVK